MTDSVLWPLLHRMPEKVRAEESWPMAYREVNEIFADNIVPMVEDDDLIWVHDYHLLLLPGILRERLAKKKNVKIGSSCTRRSLQMTSSLSCPSVKRFVAASCYVTWLVFIHRSTLKISWTVLQIVLE